MPCLSCAVPNTFSLRARMERQAFPYREFLPCLIEICRKENDLDTVLLPNTELRTTWYGT